MESTGVTNPKSEVMLKKGNEKETSDEGSPPIWFLTENTNFPENENKELSGESNSLLSMFPALKLAKWVGVLPLMISKKEIGFKWASIPTMQTIAAGGTHFFFSLVYVIVLLFFSKRKEKWLHIFQSLAFKLFVISGNVILFRVGQGLPNLMRSFSSIEYHMGSEFLPKVNKKILYLLIVIYISALGENIFSLFYEIRGVETTDFWRFLRAYSTKEHGNIIDALGYSRILGLLLLIINFYAMFVWNFCDLILAAIALTLAGIMQEFNKKVKTACEKTNNEKDVDWVHIRQLHLQMFKLNCDADEIFGYLTFLSFTTNLLSIISRGYNGIKNLNSVGSESDGTNSITDLVYLVWSFIHLLARLLLVAFTSSMYYKKATFSHSSLMAVDVKDFSLMRNIKRLIHQIENLEFGLTGVGFFLVNKQLLVAIAGTIITYEVILLEVQ